MWRVGVDSGGTFTDVCLVDAATGDVRVWKVPSTPDDPSRAIAHGVVEGLREAARGHACRGRLLRPRHHRRHQCADPASRRRRRASSRPRASATCSRSAASAGRISTICRPTSRRCSSPARAGTRCAERLRHDGRIETPLDQAQVREAARALTAAGARSIAVCFLYCYVDPRHEQRARRIVEEECPERLRDLLARGRAGVPRVRAAVDGRRERLPRTGDGRLSRAARPAPARGGDHGAAPHHPEQRRRDVLRDGARPAGAHGAVRAGHGRGGRPGGRARRRRFAISSPSTWAARPPTCR